ncbi:MAG: cation diffusion facilitator family transporter [Ktedonobacteraceae bacterium]
MQEHPHLGHSANESDPHILVHKLDEHEHNHEHGHDEPGHKGHGHEHGRIETDLYNNRTGLRAVQISTAGMLLVALVQLLIAFSGGSAGLFADALHNLGDVLTTVALWIAFVVSNRAANRQYTYGYYRAEDLAGIFIVLVIIASAVAGAVESILKLTSGNVPTQIYLSMVAAAIGCIGNEVLAQYKINVGQRINSVALVADGQHSRIDGFTSLAALLGLLGVKLGWPLADPLAGILITLVILSVVYSTSRSVLQRLLDAVDPHVVPTIVETTSTVEGVEATTQVKARWIGRTLHISMNIEVNAALTLLQAHEIAERVRHSLFHEIAGVSEVVIHTDPSSASGDMHQETAHHIQAAQRPIVER